MPKKKKAKLVMLKTNKTEKVNYDKVKHTTSVDQSDRLIHATINRFQACQKQAD